MGWTPVFLEKLSLSNSFFEFLPRFVAVRLSSISRCRSDAEMESCNRYHSSQWSYQIKWTGNLTSTNEQAHPGMHWPGQLT